MKAQVSKAHYLRIEAGEIGTSDDMKIRIASAYGRRVEDIWSYPEPEQEAS